MNIERLSLRAVIAVPQSTTLHAAAEMSASSMSVVSLSLRRCHSTIARSARHRSRHSGAGSCRRSDPVETTLPK